MNESHRIGIDYFVNRCRSNFGNNWWMLFPSAKRMYIESLFGELTECSGETPPGSGFIVLLSAGTLMIKPIWHGMMTSSIGNIFRVIGTCAGNSPVTGEVPSQRPVTRSFDGFVDLRQHKRLSKQSWGWWFETSSRPLLRHCNVGMFCFIYSESQQFVPWNGMMCLPISSAYKCPFVKLELIAPQTIKLVFRNWLKRKRFSNYWPFVRRISPQWGHFANKRSSVLRMCFHFTLSSCTTT